MKEMEKIFKEGQTIVNKFSEFTPDQTEKFKSWVETLKKEKPIDPKNRELIDVALSVAAHCKWCIVTHVKHALEEGASGDEVLHATWLAVLMGGGPALMYAQFVIKALREFGK